MKLSVASAALAFAASIDAFAPSARLQQQQQRFLATLQMSTTEEAPATSIEINNNKNVAQTEDTSREKVMTFSYDMSLEEKYEKPTYPGTGNGMSGGEDGDNEYDIIVIGSGMGGLSCAALSAKYGSKVLCLESHIKVGGSAHTFSRMHNGGKYSFEVGPSIFEGLDRPSLNPLRMIFDILEETMPVETYKGLGFWTPEGYWRFPIGSAQKFEDLLMEQCGEDGPKAIRVSYIVNFVVYCIHYYFQNRFTQFFNYLTTPKQYYLIVRNGMPFAIVWLLWGVPPLLSLFLIFVRMLDSSPQLRVRFHLLRHTLTYLRIFLSHLMIFPRPSMKLSPSLSFATLLTACAFSADSPPREP